MLETHQDMKRAQDVSLSTISATLKMHIIWILLVMVLSGILGGFYVYKVAQPRYTTSGLFVFEQIGGQSNFLEQLSGLSALGLGQSNDNSQLIPDFVNSRDFILTVLENLNLEQDVYLNPSLQAPPLKARIKGLFQGPKADPTRLQIQEGLVAVFRNNVDVENKASGSVRLYFTHSNPKVAADIVNTSIRMILADRRDRGVQQRRKEMGYLSKEVEDAQIRLDDAMTAVQSFAVTNDVRSQGDFTQKTVQLARLRSDQKQTEEAIEGLTNLIALVETVSDVSPEDTGFKTIQNKYDVFGTPGFQRLLGLPQVKIFEAGRLMELLQLQTQDLENIKTTIQKLEVRSKKDAEVAAGLSQLQRRFRIESTTFDLATERFKAQQLVGGFQNEIARVYEWAAPPSLISSPKRLLLIILSLFLGGLVGVVGAIGNALSGNKFFTHEHFQANISGAQRIGVGTILKPGRNKPYAALMAWVQSQPSVITNELAYSALNADTKFILVQGLDEKANTLGVAAVLLSKIKTSNRRVLCIDEGRQIPVPSTAIFEPSIEDTEIADFDENITLLLPQSDIEFLTNDALVGGVKKLAKDYDYVIFNAPPLASSRMTFFLSQAFDTVTFMQATMGVVATNDLEWFKRARAAKSENKIFYLTKKA